MNKVYSLFLVLLLAVGCYEDKGNYTYKDIQELALIPFKTLVVNVGDTVRIKPEITPDVAADSKNHTFKWYIDKHTRDEWNKKEFEWIADMKTDGYQMIILEITDIRNGVKYIQSGTIKINAEFVAQNSWLILSDDAGVSKLHFLKYNTTKERPDPIDPSKSVIYPTQWKEYYNVYETQNNKTALGQGPIGIQEHFVEKYGGQYCIFQQSGAVDVDGNYLKKDILFSEVFEGGAYPSGTSYLTGGNIMTHVDAVTDQQGRIFTRFKYSEELFHSGIFGKDPVSFEGEVLTNCTVYRNTYSGNNYTLINDPDHGRILLMFEGGNGDRFGDNPLMNAGKIVHIPDPASGVPDGCRSFDNFANCKIYSVVLIEANWEITVNIVYKDLTTGKFHYQQINLDKSYYGTKLTNTGMINYEIMNVPESISQIYMPALASELYIYICAANKLYLVDVNSNDYKAELYFTADSDISAIHTTKFDEETINIGTEAGWFYNIDTQNAKNKITSKLTDDKKILFKLGGFGKIVDLKKIAGVNHENY